MWKRSLLSLLLVAALLLTACVQDRQVRLPAPEDGAGPTATDAAAGPSAPPPSPTPTAAEPPTPTAAPPTPTPPSAATIAWPTPEPPTPTAPALPTAPASGGAVRLRFPAGGTTLVAEGTAQPGAPARFVLRAARGQIMDVQLSVPMAQAALAIWGADGASLKRPDDDRLWWRGTLPATQDYTLEVTAPSRELGFSLSVGIPVRISFAAGGTSARIDGSLTPAVPDLFVLKASAGQTMEVVFDSPSPGTMLEMWGFDGTLLQGEGDPSRSWIGTLPGTQEYLLYLYNWSAPASYRLEVGIPAGGEPVSSRISFPSGGTTATVSGSLGDLGQDVYVLRAGAGQILEVEVDWTGALVLLDVWGADGSVLKHAAVGGPAWRGVLPATQDYTLSLTAEGGAADYTLRVSVPARIAFARGATSATLTGSLTGYGSVLYVLGARAGQEMTVVLEVDDPAVLPSIWGWDGVPLKRDEDGAQTWTGTLPATQDYFIRVSSYGGAAHFRLTVTIP